MVYRTAATNQTQQMKFTYAERLFMSSRWYGKWLAHIIVLGKQALFLVGICATLGIVVGFIYSLICGYEILISYLINKHYISKDIAVGLTIGTMLLLFIAPKIINIIRCLIQHNTTQLKCSIQDKINGKT